MTSECMFFSGDMTGTAWCNQLNPMAFGSLQLLKSAYCNDHIMAAKKAHKHFDFLENIEAIDIEDLDAVDKEA